MIINNREGFDLTSSCDVCENLELAGEDKSKTPLGCENTTKPATHGSLGKKDPAGHQYIPLKHPHTHTQTAKPQYATALHHWLINCTNKVNAFK